MTQDLVAAGGGADVLYIYPPIYGPGSAYQNVDALPANAAALTLFPGTAAPSGKIGVNGLALGQDAFALVGVPMELPKAVEMASQTRDPNTGLAVSFIRQFDINDRRMKNRLDVAFGFGRFWAENASVRVLCG